MAGHSVGVQAFNFADIGENILTRPTGGATLDLAGKSLAFVDINEDFSMPEGTPIGVIVVVYNSDGSDHTGTEATGDITIGAGDARIFVSIGSDGWVATGDMAVGA